MLKYATKSYNYTMASMALSSSMYTHIFIYIIIYIYHIYEPLRSGRIWYKVNILTEFNRFEFRVFLLLD